MQATVLAGLLIFVVIAIGYQVVEEWGTVRAEANRMLSLLALGLPLIPVVIGSMAMASTMADCVSQRLIQRQTGGSIFTKRLFWPYVLWVVGGSLLSLGLHGFTPFSGRFDIAVLIVVAASLGVGILTFFVKYLPRT